MRRGINACNFLPRFKKLGYVWIKTAARDNSRSGFLPIRKNLVAKKSCKGPKKFLFPAEGKFASQVEGIKFAIAAGGGARAFFEDFYKVIVVVKADHAADVVNRFIEMDEKVFGLFDAHFLDIFEGGAAKVFPCERIEFVFGNIERGAQIGYGKFAVEVFAHESV